MKDDDPRHGTYNGYSNLGCRCQPCRDANAEATRAFRAKRDPALAPEHGTVSTYNNYCCRCNECTGALRDYAAWRRRRSTA